MLRVYSWFYALESGRLRKPHMMLEIEPRLIMQSKCWTISILFSVVRTPFIRGTLEEL